MSADLVGLTAEQLHDYAVGYTDALEDAGPELYELRELVRTLAAQLEQAEATAEQIYHDAYCGCHQKIAAAAVRGLGVVSARTRLNRS